MKIKGFFAILLTVLFMGSGLTIGTSRLVDRMNSQAAISITADAAKSPVKVVNTDPEEVLRDLDAFIEKRQSGLDSADIDKLISEADYEYRLWNAELSRMCKGLQSTLSKTQAKKFAEDERVFEAEREKNARADSLELKGKASENLEYKRSLASQTRERAYEVAKLYISK